MVDDAFQSLDETENEEIPQAPDLEDVFYDLGYDLGCLIMHATAEFSRGWKHAYERVSQYHEQLKNEEN